MIRPASHHAKSKLHILRRRHVLKKRRKKPLRIYFSSSRKTGKTRAGGGGAEWGRGGEVVRTKAREREREREREKVLLLPLFLLWPYFFLAAASDKNLSLRYTLPAAWEGVWGQG
jgi:hypothetical protein